MLRQKAGGCSAFRTGRFAVTDLLLAPESFAVIIEPALDLV